MGNREIKVDPEALGEVYNQMSTVVFSLEAANDQRDAFEGALGTDRLRDKYSSFISGWKDGRRKIIDEATNLAGMVAGAVEAYLENENEIIKGATESAAALSVDAEVTAGDFTMTTSGASTPGPVGA